MHLKQALRYVMRLYRRWKYLRTPRPVFEPTVTPVERHWTNTDEKLERALYLANPNAFWLRPDRHEYSVPCWQLDGVWGEDAQKYSATTRKALQRRNHKGETEHWHFENCKWVQFAESLQNPYAQAGLQNSAAQMNQLAMAQQHVSHGLLQSQSIFGGAGGSLSNLLSPLNQRN